jgi:GAF domain-containing protein
VPAGLRQIAIAPLRCAGLSGTLQLARRLPRPYSAGELLVLQLLADRLGLLFAAGQAVSASDPTREALRR